ncbi:hypothetical protein S140_195 [Shewanella sp. phage 1/40]|nr:hypothetical protein S14_194 [Shewanella sp. phage 1/4]YP_009104193.1 hypothetical protein S140_195 [Shewanella sp. phage 1/40]AHK11303.1 hypothetical protein S14_194 [Shewanella sp. phage 1/4]AHK11602.1 hypothetical protein S140_195 [Shewanella sp. phage 1/40]
MTDQRKRVQELNMLLAKRKDYMRYLLSELRSVEIDIELITAEQNNLSQ